MKAYREKGPLIHAIVLKQRVYIELYEPGELQSYYNDSRKEGNIIRYSAVPGDYLVILPTGHIKIMDKKTFEEKYEAAT